MRSSFVLVKIAMVFLLVYFFCSGIFTVGPQEKAVILRFGRPVGQGEAAVLGAGFQWAFPYPIDEVVKIPAVKVQTATSSAGWYATNRKLRAAGTEPPPRPFLVPGVDGYTLTGDGNIIHVEVTLRYRINDPIKYYFNFTNAAEVVTNILDNAIFFASARMNVDDPLTSNVAAFKEKVLGRVQALIQEQDLGILVEPSDVNAIAPRQTKAAFDAVLAAQQEGSKQINDAQGYANEILSRASGEAAALTNAGQTARTRYVESANADAQYFRDVLPHYQANPTLFASRLQTEYLERVLVGAQEKFLIPERADGRPRELRLQLSREPVKAKPAGDPKKHNH
jgi:membrane protease subunit HflK